MIHYFLVICLFILLLLILSGSLILGRHFGIVQLNNHTTSKLEVAEGAVFGLLALLMAFTFSGAYDRYEHRKMHLVEEADSFDKAYNYIDLIPKNLQPELRKNMRQYLDLYIKAYKDIPYMDLVYEDLKQAQIVEDLIWKTTVAACAESTDKTLSQIYVPAFNEMFETAHMGFYLTQIHPPRVVFMLLTGLAVLGAFLVGYNSAENKQKSFLHSFCYVLLTAFTIYIILNMEYPRVGFMGMEVFDRILIETRNNMV